MKGTESGKDKVKKICDVLRRETLEPAKEEAGEIVAAATRRADELIAEARKKIEQMQIEAQLEIDRQKKIFESSVQQGCKQALEVLHQRIEESFFNKGLSSLLSRHMQEPRVLVDLIEAVVHALEKEGMDAKFSVYIPAAVSARSVNILLAQELLQKLAEKSVLSGVFDGGVQVHLRERNLILDISSDALKELVSHYVRKDFRMVLFGEE